jgi:hypothetical protein
MQLSDDREARAVAAPDIAAALRHYKWHRLHSATFLIVALLDAGAM